MQRSYSKVIKENIKLHKSEAYFYEIGHQEIYNYLEQKRLRKEILSIARELPPKSLALDVGSGTGNIIEHARCLGLKMVACDLSKDMLKQNRAIYKVVCDASYLPFKESIFNLITSYSVFHHLLDSKEALKEFCRVSGKGSILYFDHDHFVKKEKKYRKAFQHVGWAAWLITNPRFLYRLIEYILWGRKWHLRNINSCDWELTDGAPVDTEEIICFLKNNGFEVRLCGSLPFTMG